MAKRQTKALQDQGYSKLDAWCIGVREYFLSLKRAGFSEGEALFMITDLPSYPSWILPDQVEPDRFGNYEDDDDED